jgi:predicted phosphodiesterase
MTKGGEMEMTAIKKGVGVWDLHYPHHDKKLWRNVMRFLKDFEPDVFVFGGDNMNMDAVDHWKQEKGAKRPLENKRLKGEYKGFVTEVHNPLVAVLKPECRKIWHKGNHEDWVERYIDAHPEVEGLLEIEENIPLSDWEVYDYGLTAKIGKLLTHHGEYCNKYSAAKTVEVYGRNILYGHGHTYQVYTKTTPISTESHTATEVPCACRLNPAYMQNRPNAWVNGFAVFYVLPNGNFNVYTVVAVNGRFVAPNGKVYE